MLKIFLSVATGGCSIIIVRHLQPLRNKPLTNNSPEEGSTLAACHQGRFGNRRSEEAGYSRCWPDSSYSPTTSSRKIAMSTISLFLEVVEVSPSISQDSKFWKFMHYFSVLFTLRF
nr:hypothetical protein Iba_chr07aCG6640 [Ipomoea batatas]